MNTARNTVMEIAERLAAAGCKQPHPDSIVCSERMLNLSALFDFIGNIAAAGCFKSMAAEVAELEHDAAAWREYAKLRDAAMSDDTVRFSITTKRHGKSWGVDYAFSQIDLSSVGEELSARRVGMAAEQKYRQLQAAINEAQ